MIAAVSSKPDISPVLEIQWNLPTERKTFPYHPTRKNRQTNCERNQEQADEYRNQLECYWAHNRHTLHSNQVEGIQRSEQEEGAEVPD